MFLAFDLLQQLGTYPKETLQRDGERGYVIAQYQHWKHIINTTIGKTFKNSKTTPHRQGSL